MMDKSENKNVKQFLLNKVLNYYQEALMPSLACMGVKSHLFIPLLEELACEVSSGMTLSKHEQKEFLDLLTDVSIQMFDGDLLIHLINHKNKLRNYLKSCYLNGRS